MKLTKLRLIDKHTQASGRRTDFSGVGVVR